MLKKLNTKTKNKINKIYLYKINVVFNLNVQNTRHLYLNEMYL